MRFFSKGALAKAAAGALVLGGVAAGGMAATPAAHASVPAVQIATNQGSSSLCMNRSGGGVADGTPVISYNCNDPHDDFEFIQLTAACGNGYVHSTQYGSSTNCPFANPEQDAVNHGYAIVEIYSYDSYACVGNPSSSGGGTAIEPCGDTAGNGAGWSTMNVLVGVNNFANYNGAAKNVQNRHWTDYYNTEKWLCAGAYQNSWSFAGSAPSSGACQIRQVG